MFVAWSKHVGGCATWTGPGKVGQHSADGGGGVGLHRREAEAAGTGLPVGQRNFRRRLMSTLSRQFSTRDSCAGVSDGAVGSVRRRASAYGASSW
jgi:hypothetical protein